MLSLNKYDEYGVPQGTNLGRFGYTGQAWVPEIGLWYYKARFLRPDIGRFLQTDPIGYEGGTNLYAYVGNEPVNLIDPLGLQCANNCTATVSATRRGGGIPPAGQPSFGHMRHRDPNEPGSDEFVLVQAERIVKRPAPLPASQLAGAPPEPPGENACNAPLPDGSTINQNVDKVRDMLRRGERIRGVGESFGAGWPFAVGAWVGLVQPGGRWDYKRSGGTEDQGNMNYGATGAQLFPMDILLRGAGAVQEDPRDLLPGGPLDLPPSTYGDDPHDAAKIREGARLCRGTGQ